MKVKTGLGLMLLGLLSLLACSDGNPQATNQPAKPPAVVVKTPEFNADSAYHFIEQQLAFGPRVPNSSGHIMCAQWLQQKLQAYGASVIVQETIVNAFDGTPLQAKNIIASFQPEKANRLLLSAHWDTRPFADEDDERVDEPILGANDGGSGVGVLLELARLFSQQMPGLGVDIILWDAEDYGKSGIDNSYCLGSQYWSQNKHQPNYQARFGINLDMVGAPDATFLKEGVSMQMASAVVQKVWSASQRLGYGKYFLPQRVAPIVDDHVYMNSPGGVKSIDIIHMEMNGGFFEHWHTHGDNMDAISKATLKAVGQTVAEVVYQEK